MLMRLPNAPTTETALIERLLLAEQTRFLQSPNAERLAKVAAEQAAAVALAKLEGASATQLRHRDWP